MEDANLCTIHHGRITITPKDYQLVMRMRERMGDTVALAKKFKKGRNVKNVRKAHLYFYMS